MMPASTAGLDASRIEVRIDGTLIVDGIDCTVPAGTLTALLGPNGAGKSTLLRALAAIERPTAGTVSFAGSDLFALSRRARARLASLVEQDAATDLAFTVRAVVALGRTPHQSLWEAEDAADAAVIAESLEAVGMTAFGDRAFPSLSGGERQRVLLAKALAQQPSLLVLDEPTNHLDVSAQLSTLQLLTRVTTSGVTVLAALHDLNLAAAWSDAVIVVRAGVVVAAGPTASTLTPSLVREVYGVEAHMLENPATGRPVIAFSPLVEGSAGLGGTPKHP